MNSGLFENKYENNIDYANYGIILTPQLDPLLRMVVMLTLIMCGTVTHTKKITRHDLPD